VPLLIVAALAVAGTAHAANTQDPPAAEQAAGSDTAAATADPQAVAQPETASADAQALADHTNNGNGNANGNGNGNASPDGYTTAIGDGTATADGYTAASGNGNGNGNGNAYGHDTDAKADAKADSNSSQAQPNNTNVNARVDQAGNNGGVSQNNTSHADAAAGASNDAGPANANADANASQSSPSNVNVSARVNSPGNDGAVQQSNTTSANAGAGAAGADGSQAAANAGANQSSPLNVNVSVRVASPGDQGAVSQTNSANATASGISPQLTPDTSGLPNSPTNTATVDNSASIGQQLEQCGDDCAAAAQPSAVGGAATLVTTDTSATANQVSPTNLNISVRVASPGQDGSVGQTNVARADGASATATTTGDSSLSVTIVVDTPVDSVSAPGNGQPWVWRWAWSLNGTPPSNGAPTDSNNWDWNWSAPTAAAASTQTTDESDVTPVAGHWIWRWTWDNGKVTVGFTSDRACACTWVWDWTWTGSPPAASSDASSGQSAAASEATAAEPQVTQSNVAAASASAEADTSIAQATQAATDFATSGAQLTDQSVVSTQVVMANATVDQTGAGNFSFVGSGVLTSVEQTNTVGSIAVATARFVVTQTVSQSQVAVNDGAVHQQVAGQGIDNLQSAFASARAAQAHSRNRNDISSKLRSLAPIGAIVQANSVLSAALATSKSSLTQTISQLQTGGGAKQIEIASQWAVNIQAADASAEVAQAFTGNVNDVDIPARGLFNPPLSQSNAVSALGQMTNMSSIEQEITQNESGAFNWIENADQTATIVQTGDASANAVQAGHVNIAGWNGPIAPEPTGTPGPISSSTTPLGHLGGSTVKLQSAFAVGQGAGDVSDAVKPSSSRGRSGVGHPSTPRVHRTVGAKPYAGGSATSRTHVPFAATATAARTPATASSSTSASKPSRGPVPPWCSRAECQNGFQFGSAPTRSPATGAFAAITRPFRLAAPGVGRLLDHAPTLGRSVDIAAFERPG
jgi:hypothetical protein